MDNEQLKDAVRLLATWIVTDCIDHMAKNLLAKLEKEG